MVSQFKNTLLKVVILGDGGVGKSCLMNRFVKNHFDEHSFHTIGVEFMNKEIQVDGENYTLQIWDTAGQERFRALRTPFYRGSDVCLLTYAVDDSASFKGLQEWREEFLRYADVSPDTFPFIVVGNKCDVPPEARQISLEYVADWCNDNHITCFIETSAKTSQNVLEAFTLAVRQWLSYDRKAESISGTDPLTVDLKSQRKVAADSSCCGSGDT
ncbi:ras-related protein Rab-9A-like [Ctenocephalides felis]|uniref:ras-related protein Rab-9A-like n=1 Tax=Ctenocephalides felis TaxID=7515 RepID=UPI000E6E5873|nr:ras-related protein Rab-9A-like [Ctenocephalides felis]